MQKKMHQLTTKIPLLRTAFNRPTQQFELKIKNQPTNRQGWLQNQAIDGPCPALSLLTGIRAAIHHHVLLGMPGSSQSKDITYLLIRICGMNFHRIWSKSTKKWPNQEKTNGILRRSCREVPDQAPEKTMSHRTTTMMISVETETQVVFRFIRGPLSHKHKYLNPVKTQLEKLIMTICY